MIKKTFLSLVIYLACFLCFEAGAQTTVFPKPSECKTSWQRLLLQLSQAFYTAAKENQVDLDSSLIYCAHSLGLSRLPVIAEGLDAPGMAGKLKWIDKRDPKIGLQMLSTSTGKKHLELLVFLGAYYAFEPKSYHRYKDTVLYFLNRAISESKTQHEEQLGWQARLLIGKMYVDGYDFRHGAPIFDQLIKDCQSAGDQITEAKVWFYRGLYTGFTPGTVGQRIAYLHQAQKLYHEQNNPEGEINALTDISYLNVPIYQLDKARKASLEALSLAESISFPFIHYNTDAVAMITSFEGKFGEPLRYALKTVRVAEAVHDSIGLGGFYNRVGVLYDNEDPKHQEAQKWLNKAVNTMTRTGNDNVLYLTVANLVYSLNAKGDLNKAWSILLEVSKKMPPKTPVDKLNYNLAYSWCYIMSKNFGMAEKYVVMAYSIEQQLEKNGYSFRRALVTEGFGDLYFFKGDYGKARINYERYLSDPSRASTGLPSELYALEKLIGIDSIQRDDASEVHHFRLYKKLADSNYVISRTRQAEELQVKYATAEKESQIALLNQKAKLENVNLNKATLIKNVTIGGILLVMVIAGLLYRQSRLRQRNNKTITHQNKLITNKNELLQNLLEEKEWLMKEIHHRVKNNLQIVISLLNTQSNHITNDIAFNAIRESQHRMQSISLIHQKLYQSECRALIEAHIYIAELIEYLSSSFDTGNRIRFEKSLVNLELDVSRAVPIGLILNEAITNSIKYAFPNNADGCIIVSLSCIEEDNFRLCVSDNGIGLPEGFDIAQCRSLGMNLMRGLCRQIGSSLQLEHNNGLSISIDFKNDRLLEPNINL